MADYFLTYISTGEKLPLEVNKTIILGRTLGPLKSIVDNKCSRRQAEVTLISTNDGVELKIEACGVNPVIVQQDKGEPMTLTKSSSIELKHNTTFYLIPYEYQFKVNLSGKLNKSTSGSVTTKSDVKEAVDEMDIEKTEELDDLPALEEKLAAENSKKNSNNNNKDDNGNQKPKTLRPLCKYRNKCYNRNNEHTNKYSHPCKYGNECYRKEIQHLKMYYHPWDESPSIDDEEDEKSDDKNNKKSSNNNNKNSEELKKKAPLNPWFEGTQHDDDDDEKPSTKKKPTGILSGIVPNQESSSDDDDDDNNNNNNKKIKKEEIDPMEDDEEDNDDNDDDDIDSMSLLGKLKNKPKHPMKEGEIVVIEGLTDKYEIMLKGGVYSCTCTAWKQQSLPLNLRSCKHLREHLGDSYETERIGSEAVITAAATKKANKVVPKLLLANKWEMNVNPVGWWLSEKLDGVRAYWDGKRFVSRLGNEFTCPSYFKKSLPTDMTLDGELWCGRKLFQITVGIVRSSGESELWKKVKYKVFDSPSMEGVPFEDRMKKIQKWYNKNADTLPFVEIVDQQLCKSVDHLKERLSEVEELGGEGLMLRQANSLYVGARSSTLLKVKTFHDAEAKVLKYEPGKGKHSGKVGALWCELPNGKNFSVGSGLSDYQRSNPPAIGTVITFRYQELSDAGIPRFPTFVGVRADAEWPPKEDPLAKTKHKAPAKELLLSMKEKEKKKNINNNNININTNKKKQGKEEVEDDDDDDILNKPKVETKKKNKHKAQDVEDSPAPKKHKSNNNNNNNKNAASGGKALEGITLAITGTHSMVRKAIIDLIQQNGGVFAQGVSKNITYLMATASECVIGTSKVDKARRLGIPIVSEEFLNDCIAKGHPLNHKKYLVDNDN